MMLVFLCIFSNIGSLPATFDGYLSLLQFPHELHLVFLYFHMAFIVNMSFSIFNTSIKALTFLAALLHVSYMSFVAHLPLLLLYVMHFIDVQLS